MTFHPPLAGFPARTFLILLLALVWLKGPAFADTSVNAPSSWRPSDGDRIVFDVLRNGQPFGRHSVVFRESEGRLEVATDIELKASFGPLTLFHYIHQSTETWKGGQLAGVRARTKKDGRWSELAAEAVQGGLRIMGVAFRGVRPGLVIPSSHWNLRQMLQTEMLSTETGEMLPMKVVDQGVETVRTAIGDVRARRYLVRSQMDATFWYDDQGRWVKCAFLTEGQSIEYVLRERPA